MKQRTYLHVLAAALIGGALVAGLAAPSLAQIGRTRGSRSSYGRGAPGLTARPATRPTTQVAATALTAAHPDWSWYDASVVQQNIFLRQRGRPGFVRAPSTQRAGPSASSWVLCGIVLEAADRVAFLENERTGATIRVHVGENVGSSKVVQVEQDYLEIETRGANRKVAIGAQLSGEPAALVRSPAVPPPGGAGGSGESGPVPENTDAGPGTGGSIFVDEGLPADGGGPGMADQGDQGGDQAAAPDNGGDNAGAPAAPLSPEEEMIQRLIARRAAELNK